MQNDCYSQLRPKDCKCCYFWINHKKGCRLGKEHCYYLVKKVKKKRTLCSCCPYNRDRTCMKISCYLENLPASYFGGDLIGSK